MLMKDIIPDILLVLKLPLKITADVICNHSVGKLNLKVFKLQLIKIYFADVQYTVGSLQHRGSEHLSHRYIHICHAVFKNRLLLRVGQLIKLNRQVRPVLTCTQDSDMIPLV